MQKNNVSILLENCRCGEQLKTKYDYVPRVDLMLNGAWFLNPFVATSSYCLKRKWWNFWKHDKEQLLVFRYIKQYDEN